MFNSLLLISLAPVFIIAFYIYNRDRYEKEPVSILIRALILGILCVLPVMLIEYVLTRLYRGTEGIKEAAYTAFIVAGFTEEAIKFLALWLFFWRNRNFNEKFDAIVYAVYIALGFAAVENIIYVFQGGFGVGLARALTAVPAHALFGIMMGYNFGLARFNEKFRIINLIAAFTLPIVAHGAYDFLLIGNSPVLLIAFIPLLILYWITGFRRMKKLSDDSVFKNSLPDDQSMPGNVQ
ncbi:MAG: PrsW family glutamic-type intramembrane protease [Bacteroidales bacterium]|jgi:RsiW-degrading membrane proteinase PrsW (M82 family)|nr:PrsW family glutamic-type intramembrane protease [Bacteroidales bacterium]